MSWGLIFLVFVGSKSGGWLVEDALGAKKTQKTPQKGQKAGGHILVKNGSYGKPDRCMMVYTGQAFYYKPSFSHIFTF